ncbi:MAG: hypothetical protein AW09_001206 [Candidatus Accumulibacter phosphatis]|uniref:Uncharacterized protein n=1 Tax=Candidatus Accumulibacter phosphatis TaxID=327160 RepID=A0A080M8T3_9PROT|nr:MAG: hypothetical protein AW09_001206 [Candidatus Accumulibacter phosphatis]
MVIDFGVSKKASFLAELDQRLETHLARLVVNRYRLAPDLRQKVCRCLGFRRLRSYYLFPYHDHFPNSVRLEKLLIVSSLILPCRAAHAQ